MAAVVESVLFASDSPITAGKIGTVAELPVRSVKQAIKQLNERYEQAGSAFRIEEIAGGYRMMSMPEYHDVLKRLLNVTKDNRLSQAAMETLAIVAYRQPILRADIEAIRGVACGEMLRSLLEKQLVKIAGRAEVIGRPMLYGTTRRFLEIFGLGSLNDLPRAEELRSAAEKFATPQAQQSPDEEPETPLFDNDTTDEEPPAETDEDDEKLDDEELDEEFDEDDDEFDEEEDDDEDDDNDEE
ncbi:MAG: SMC-Scp complex subunit ScpB [Phycisphaerae bacterium]|nr:SMC-Scp complex subunit ScpB [Phycisphaerae bacterium]